MKSRTELMEIKAFPGELKGRTMLYDSTFGQRVHVNFKVHAAGFVLSAYGRTDNAITFSVYGWTENYEKTVQNPPLASRRFEGVEDDACCYLYFDTPLDAGEYLFSIGRVAGYVGIYRDGESWGGGTNGSSKGYYYEGGVPRPYDTSLCLLTDDMPNEPFSPCLEYQDTTDGTHTPPAKTELPADSLVYTHEVMPDTWVFVDGLGRRSLTHKDVGDVKPDKEIGMFFWDWHDVDGWGYRSPKLDSDEPVNIQKAMDKHPEAKNDYNHPVWGNTDNAHQKYFWNEPVYGHYMTGDRWVLRRQAELLANAGVDFIMTDNTNGDQVWQSGYRAMMDEWHKATKSGVKAPKVSFFLPFTERWGGKTNFQLSYLYNDIYRKNKWQDMWYYLDGKPMVLARGEETLGDDNFGKELKSFFTFRKGVGQYVNEGELGEWGWLSMYPQTLYYKTEEDRASGNVEQTTVGIAVNYDYTFDVQEGLSSMNGEHIVGRSFSPDCKDRFEKEGREATKWGYNFSAQFDYALTADPRVIFITGWNEWHVIHHPKWRYTENAFADQFDDEHSRDIEPSRGELRDHYYYLLVNYVRKFKGARPIPAPSGKKTIDLRGGAEQWADVKPYYAAYIGNTGKRDCRGWGSAYFKDESGRNDIIGAQVARDDGSLYFRVECNDSITPCEDDRWMNLYIDTDGEYNGWESFNYVVKPTADGVLSLNRFTGNGYGFEVISGVEYALDGKYLTVKISKAALGLGDKFTVNFAWTDNVHDKDDSSKFSGDILEFYTTGDVAPGGRFKYSYICE
ncbi:MAG: hypothetical protein E7589_08255 [Ruminococcaceae bacterium]|nr:hypothetical protein [Oscillospiraceae bacterium]